MLRDRPLVSIRGLRVTFQTDDGPVEGLRALSLDIAAGECLCVVGESGSGKTLSALSLMRLVEFGGGTIAAGKLLFQRADGALDLALASQGQMRALRGDQIAMVFQEPMTALNPVLSIGDQLTEGLTAHRGLTRSQARVRALALLAEVGMADPGRRLRQYPHELSGGMRQRIVIAMAMACRPRLLICDEPTTALDVTTQAQILALIDRLRRETGMAVLFITHDMAVVAQMGDRVAVLRQGEKIEEGAVAQIFETPAHPYTQALLGAVPRLGAMAGRDAPAPLRGADPAPRNTTAQSGPLLEVAHLTVRFPVRRGILRRTVAQVHAVQDVSFTIGAGETLSLVGESGCGKSTTARAILRLVAPVSGRITLGGRDLLALGPADLRQARRGMQMIFQDPFASLDPQMRLFDQIEEPLLNYGIGTRSERHDRIAHLFDRVDLPHSLMRRYPHELSGGQRQRIAIARALALAPRLLVADEAVSALDVSVQAQVLDLLVELQRDLGLAMLFISHDMAVVERISHRVAVMHRGRVVEIGSRRQVFETPQHSYTRRLLAAVPQPDPRRRTLAPAEVSRPLSVIPPEAASVYAEVAPGHRVLMGPATPG
mgnify:CR=1 FL=1